MQSPNTGTAKPSRTSITVLTFYPFMTVSPSKLVESKCYILIGFITLAPDLVPTPMWVLRYLSTVHGIKLLPLFAAKVKGNSP